MGIFQTLNGQILSQFHNFRSGHIYQISSKNTFRHANKEAENDKMTTKILIHLKVTIIKSI